MRNLIIKFTLCGLLFLVALELFARAEDSLRWGAPFWGHYHLEGIRDVDARGTVRCAENARYKHFQLGEHGFRDTPLVSAGDQLFVWLGSSEAFGLYESAGQDVANQLERTLLDLEQERGLRIDVVNASCFGLNLTRMERLLEDPITAMQPEYLALYPTPHFYLDNQMVAPDAPPTSTTAATTTGTHFESRLVAKSRDVLKMFLPSQLQDRLRHFQVERATAGASVDWLWHEPPVDRLALFEADLRSLLDAATATTARVALLTHANAFHRQAEPSASTLQAWQKFYPRATGDVLIQFDAAANALVRRLAAEYGVDLIDIADQVSGAPDLFADFSHFTDEGAARTAAALAAWVSESQPSPLPPRQDTRP